ncbi:MAG: hypothetical protein LBL71_02560 [Endomicrobium sp.]|jgi:hypothetical protein|nr:hypothetical protein [Endomicrobium sp.]
MINRFLYPYDLRVKPISITGSYALEALIRENVDDNHLAIKIDLTSINDAMGAVTGSVRLDAAVVAQFVAEVVKPPLLQED